MSEKKWTPGPWLVRQRDCEGEDYHEIGASVLSEELGLSGITGSGRYFLVSGCIDCHDANLIAAAPDLYEALETILARWLDPGSITEEHWKAARSALARARGEAT